MMRSWGAEEKDSDNKENSLAEIASVWVDELGGSAEYKEFSPKQREGTDYEKDDPNDSDVLDLQSELWDEKRKISGAKIVESFSGLSTKSDLMGEILTVFRKDRGNRRI